MTDSGNLRLLLLEEENRLLRKQVSDTQGVCEQFMLAENVGSPGGSISPTPPPMPISAKAPDKHAISNLLRSVRQRTRSATQVVEIAKRRPPTGAKNVTSRKSSGLTGLPREVAESALRISRESLDEARRHEFRSRILHLEAKNAELCKELDGAREKSGALLLEVERLAGELEGERDGQAVAIAEAAESHVQVVLLKGEIEGLATELESARDGQATATAEAAESHEQVDLLKGEIESLTTALESARDEQAAAIAEAAESQVQVDALKGEIEGLTTALETARDKQASAIAEAGESQAQVDALKGEIERLTMELEAARDEQAAAISAKDEAHTRIDEQTDELERLTAELDSARDEQEAAAAATNEARARVEELESELGRLTESLEEADHEQKTSVQMTKIQRSDLAELQERYSDLLERSAATEKLCDQMREKVEAAWSCLVELINDTEADDNNALASRMIDTLRLISSSQ